MIVGFWATYGVRSLRRMLLHYDLPAVAYHRRETYPLLHLVSIPAKF